MWAGHHLGREDCIEYSDKREVVTPSSCSQPITPLICEHTDVWFYLIEEEHLIHWSPVSEGAEQDSTSSKGDDTVSRWIRTSGCWRMELDLSGLEWGSDRISGFLDSHWPGLVFGHTVGVILSLMSGWIDGLSKVLKGYVQWVCRLCKGY